MEAEKFTHSLSQPEGMDRTPPGTPKKSGKMLAVKVQMLDDSVTMFQVQAKALGRVLFDQVCCQLHLLESDYFGLEYQEVGGPKYWLDLEKPLSRQIGLSLIDTLIKFCVKFYTPDPSQLEEEFTRYLFCLQIKRDLAQGLLQCNSNTAALMASYIVQAECGDYVVEDYPDHRYLSSYKFVPNQDQELERRIMENHKKHAGQSPAEADLNLLETARRCELYGIKMHAAKDHEGVPLNLAVAHMGIVVFQNFTKINTFSWAKIRKISFKRKRFLVKLHPEGYGYYKDTVEFFFEGRNECKNFWKKCVENHGFFRCSVVKKFPRQKTRVLSRGSSFRYSGRTQKQIVDFVRENYVKRQTFQRSQSFRHSSSAHSSVANVGTSISAHPLLPLGENAVAGTPVSLSCGSMTLTSSPLHTADIHGGGSPSPPLTTSASLGTSITSSPQHFYPQESPFHRPDHHRAKVKVPHVHSHHGISPHQSPTGAATAVTNHSASLSNNNNIFNNNSNNINNNSNYNNATNYAKIMNKDAKVSNVNAESPDLTNVNDIYSNCYSSLRNLKSIFQDTELNHNEPTETDICFLNEPLPTSQSHETKIRSSTHKFAFDTDIYSWNQSSSSKDLYHEENLIPATENDKNLKITSKKKYNEEIPFEIDCDSRVSRHDYSKRKCYSAISSQTPFADQTVDLMSNVKIYSSSYPGTSSSLSTESVEAEPEVQISDVIDVKYDSQEEMVLSHDDVSHDSYELLEKELDYFENEPVRNKRKTTISDSDRARSCSWGSDGSVLSSLDAVSTDILNSEYQKSREKEFWSITKEKNSKPKSENDFRILEWKKDISYSKGMESCTGHDDLNTKRNLNPVSSKKGKERDSFNYNPEIGWEFKKKDKNSLKILDLSNKRNETTTPTFDLRNFEDEKTCFKIQDGKSRISKEDKGFDRDSLGVKNKSKYEIRKINQGENDFEDFIKEKQGRFEDKRKAERKRIKKNYEEETFHEQIQEEERREWEKEKEKRMIEKKKNSEEKFRYDENSKKPLKTSANIYADFREIKFKKFDRVVSNQFGKYSEFLTQENDYDVILKDQKRLENQDKKSKIGNILKESDRHENVVNYEDSKILNKENIYEVPDQDFSVEVLTSNKSFFFSDQEKGNEKISPVSNYSPKGSNKFAKTLLERTQSDSYGSERNVRRSQLLHQKSVTDLTPQRSKEESSDYDNEDYISKTSRSEHDIPYILHKRQCMNGTARNIDFSKLSDDLSFSDFQANTVPLRKKGVGNLLSFSKTTETEVEVTKNREDCRKQKKYLECGKRGIQIINLDETNDKITAKMLDSIKSNKILRSEPLAAKKFSVVENKTDLKNDKIKDFSKFAENLTNQDLIGIQKNNSEEKTLESNEPIYAKVCKKKETNNNMSESLKGTSSSRLNSSFSEEENFGFSPISGTQRSSFPDFLDEKLPPEPPKRTTSQTSSPPVNGKIIDSLKENKLNESKDGKSKAEEKIQPAIVRGKQGSVLQRRGESLILYARTRLGLSEGSAFIPFVREGQVAMTPRRTKSLDAPYVSVHRLPPADAFSSKDDTVDGNDEVIPEAVRSEKAEETIKSDEKAFPSDLSANTESDVDSVFSKDVEEEVNFKKIVNSQSKLEISNAEKKILNGIRNKRLLSKIESVDAIDSEGDLDSSKLADASPIPSDRMVNLPESVRFPSVRQISGQTSEESADGWEPKEVKLKRRTPRRSVGREDYDTPVQESVVWDSKDEESINDEVWDDNVLGSEKYDGSGIPATIEYLKRGSCGQSIDDDNLSTPMKESSPEHWVSVEDLPEALEREEKLLKRQEKLLREKILNEKLKRELNLDSIDLDYNYKDSLGRACDASMVPQTKFKGHSLDTYELTEKKLRELGNTKNSSLDEHILNNKFRKSCFDGRIQRSSETFEFTRMDTNAYDKNIGYVQCTVVNDLAEIDQFEGSGEELEEFFVVLDENLGSDKEINNSVWNQSNSFNRSASKEESVISVPEEFKDVDEDLCSKMPEDQVQAPSFDSPDSKSTEEKSKKKTEMEKECFSEDQSFRSPKNENLCFEKANEEKENIFYAKIQDISEYSSKFVSESHALTALSEECLKDVEERFEPPIIADDIGCLSPYESLSRRSSDCLQRRSTSETPDRLSPFHFYDSRRGSEDPRRLSTSEDSRKYSISESVSEETRRRLSSTEETRRKRASLTKQCSVGEESLSDEVILGIQECSSSFEQEEKDVFEAEATGVDDQKGTEPTIVKIQTVEDLTENSSVIEVNKSKEQQFHEFELEVVDKSSSENYSKNETESKEIDKMHLVPPSNERELSRETEDSVDYCEDFKDIRDTIKEKDISEGLICENDVALVKSQNSRSLSSIEKTESSDGDELRYIDEKRGSTPEIIIGGGKEAVSVSVVVVNEGLAVLNKMVRKDKGFLGEGEKALSLPKEKITGAGTSCYENTRHTLPKLSRDIDNSQNITKRNYLISTSNNSDFLKSSLESSQESDVDKLCEVSVVSQIHGQIVKRNLSDVGKRLRHSESEKSTEEASLSRSKTLEELSKSECVSTDIKSVNDSGSRRHKKEDSKLVSKLNLEKEKIRKDIMGKEKKSPEQEKRDSGEDGSSSSSAPPYPKRELSSTWKPFILESSGSSSLEEGWLPPDDAHFADEEETSSTSNNQQDDSCHDDVDYPTGIGYPVMNTSSAEMMVGGYNTVFGLSRTLSRISERSTSEQERSDFEDDFSKPSSHSVSVEEESILSSDRQISLSSDPPSPKSNSAKIPELPDDRPLPLQPHTDLEVKSAVSEPFGDFIPPPIQEDDWPSPPSSSSILDTPIASHVETVYLEIYPEEAAKVMVPEPHNYENSSSDENQTLQEEGEYFHLSSENISLSTTTTTTLEGTVIMPARIKSARTGSFSEDLTLTSTSEWSSPTTLKSRKTNEELSAFDETNSQISKLATKIKPLKLRSPTSKVFGFFETPVSKVRSPTSQNSFFESGDSYGKSLKSHSESSSPKNHKKVFESPNKGKCYKKEPKSHSRRVTSPYYSNAAEIAEKSYFGRYDTGSLERTKIHSSRKCFSYYSVAKTVPDEKDSSNSEEIPVPTSNTIPRASKKTKKRHKVALNLEIRDGRIVTSPKTRSYVLENSDSDRSSPKKEPRKN